jgi:hypothetical protein
MVMNSPKNTATLTSMEAWTMQTGRVLSNAEVVEMIAVTESSKMLDKRRESREVEEELELKRKACREHVKSMEQREAMLEQKREQLQANLVKFNKLIADNETKRTRALRKVADEIANTEAKKKEIEELKSRLNEWMEKRMEITEDIAACSKYYNYLESICRARPDDFNDVRDIITRWQILKETEHTLFERKRELEDKCIELDQQLDKFKKQHFNRMLSANKQRNQMQHTLEYTREETYEAQGEAEYLAQKQREAKFYLGASIMSIQYIYQRVMDYKNRNSASAAAAAAAAAAATAATATVTASGASSTAATASPTMTGTGAASSPTSSSLSFSASHQQLQELTKQLDFIGSFLYDFRGIVAGGKPQRQSSMITLPPQNHILSNRRIPTSSSDMVAH